MKKKLRAVWLDPNESMPAAEVPPASTNGRATTKGRPFKPGPDARRGRGFRKGAPNAGRPPDWLRVRMANGREEAVERLVAEIRKLDYDQLLRLVEKWAPEAEQERGVTITVRWVEE